jgi:hypothetical protein
VDAPIASITAQMIAPAAWTSGPGASAAWTSGPGAPAAWTSGPGSSAAHTTAANLDPARLAGFHSIASRGRSPLGLLQPEENH